MERQKISLKKLLQDKKNIRAIEASNGLTSIIAENTNVNGKEFDALWFSSLCDATLRGKADNGSVDFSKKLISIDEILKNTSKPLIVDGDTGGSSYQFMYTVKMLERAGASAVIIEDKKGLKQNSLIQDASLHTLEDKDVFANKIKQGKSCISGDDFMIIARIESFIAGKNVYDAIKRADTYINAGADGIMIHSNKADGKDIFCFMSAFREKHPTTPLILVPTTYNLFTAEELFKKGANVVIYANQLLRSAYKTMKQVAERILVDDSTKRVDKNACISVKEILELTEESAHD